jgi:hypothetical protein
MPCIVSTASRKLAKNFEFVSSLGLTLDFDSNCRIARERNEKKVLFLARCARFHFCPTKEYDFSLPRHQVPPPRATTTYAHVTRYLALSLSPPLSSFIFLFLFLFLFISFSLTLFLFLFLSLFIFLSLSLLLIFLHLFLSHSLSFHNFTYPPNLLFFLPYLSLSLSLSFHHLSPLCVSLSLSLKQS